MFHALLLSSIAVLGLGADDKPQNWKEVVADLNRQINDASKEQESLLAEKKKLESAFANEKEHTKRRLIALEAQIKAVLADLDAKERTLHVAERNSRELALAIKESTKNIAVLQAAIDGMRKELKVIADERDNLQRKLVYMTDRAESRKILLDQLAKAVKEKRYDDAQRLAEEATAKETHAQSSEGKTQK